MKKTFLLLLIAILLFSLTSCKYDYVESEDIHLVNSSSYVTLLTGVTYDMAIAAYHEQYPTDDTVIYLPQSGEFKTKDGETFISEVGSYCQVHFLEDTEHSRLCFDIRILNEDGEVIVERTRFCSYVQVGTTELDLDYVSEEFAKYWEVIAVRSDKLQ